MNNKELEKIVCLLEEGTEIIEPKDGLRKKLVESRETNSPLRIKLGFDPTAPDLHLGHAVVLKKLRQFQDLNHQIIVIIGDYTARRGDPSGRKDSRPPLSKEEVEKNAQTYLDQLGLILDLNKVEIRKNSEWFTSKSFCDALDLAEKFNISRLFERKEFGDRYRNNQSITLSELLYPALQGQDSVEIDSDVEIGGTDQIYNLLVGRYLQRYNQKKLQIALCMPLLPGLDGVIKMSKSKNNYIGLTDPPEIMFQKIMSLKDKVFDGEKEILVIIQYIKLLISDNYKKQSLMLKVSSIESGKSDPCLYTEIKKELAFDIVCQIYGEEKAKNALLHSESIQNMRLGSARVYEYKLPDQKDNVIPILDLCREMLIQIGINPIGANNPKKLIEVGAVKVDGNRCINLNEKINLKSVKIVSIGKKMAFTII